MGICSPYVSDNIGRITIYTSSTRPSSGSDFYVGKVIFESDTGDLVIWNGSAWVEVYDAGKLSAWTTYTPTTGNITTPTVSGRYRLIDAKTLAFSIACTAGTATAAAPVTFGLPAGKTSAAVIQPVNAIGPLATPLVITSAQVLASATAVTVYSTNAGANFAIGNSVANLRISGVIEVV